MARNSVRRKPRRKMIKTRAIQRRDSIEVATRALRPAIRTRLDKAIASLNPHRAIALEDIVDREKEKEAIHGKSA